MERIEALPVKSMEQFAQISYSGRFQEYIKTEDFSADNMDAPAVSPGLGAIDVPLQFVQAENDAVCPVNMNRRLMREIGDAVSLYTEIPGIDHEYFFWAVTSDEFFEIMQDQLEYIKISDIESV